MPNYGTCIHSKAIDIGDVSVYSRYGIERDHFATEVERKTYDYIRNYAEQNRGQAPSYATVVSEINGFDYVPGVTDSFEFLVGKLKDAAGKRLYAEKFNGGELVAKFAELSAEEFGSYLKNLADGVKMRTSVRKSIGIDISTGAERFLSEYDSRKEGRSFRIWRSKFPTINEAIGGGYYSSNMYVVYARSGRGKSVITMEEAIEFAFQGATVLIWALEMGWFEWFARAYSSISGRQGVVKANIDGVDYDAGFENQSLQAAKLPQEYEEAFRQFVSQINEILPGRIIVRATNDPDFTSRNLAALRADILEVKADVVVVDPFYYLDYESNTSKTAGGDAAATSKKLRIMTGALDVVTIAITQADEDEREKNDDGVREIRPPKRAEIKKTKQLLEDAAVTLGIDTVAQEGRGIIEIGKGRNGGEDTRVELLYLPNYGIVRELSEESDSSKFVGNF